MLNMSCDNYSQKVFFNMKVFLSKFLLLMDLKSHFIKFSVKWVQLCFWLSGIATFRLAWAQKGLENPQIPY